MWSGNFIIDSSAALERLFNAHAPLKLFIWPCRSASFEASGIALVLCDLPENLLRAQARLIARKRLRELCAQLLGSTALTETARGPACLAGYISLSYAGNKLLIGLSRDEKLGVDIVAAAPPPEIDTLTRLYLPESSGSIPFALAWAQMEAGSKALGLALAEISGQRSRQLARCNLIPCEQLDGYAIAIATVAAEDLCKTDD